MTGVEAASAALRFPIGSFLDAVRLWRFVLTVCRALGTVRRDGGALLLLTELAGLESLGRSYLSPFGRAEVKGALVRPRLVRQKWRDGALKPWMIRVRGDEV